VRTLIAPVHEGKRGREEENGNNRGSGKSKGMNGVCPLAKEAEEGNQSGRGRRKKGRREDPARNPQNREKEKKSDTVPISRKREGAHRQKRPLWANLFSSAKGGKKKGGETAASSSGRGVCAGEIKRRREGAVEKKKRGFHSMDTPGDDAHLRKRRGGEREVTRDV